MLLRVDYRPSANSYLKTVIQALQDYTLTSWTGGNAVLHTKTQDTELIVHAQLNADIRRLYKLDLPEIDNNGFSLSSSLQLVPVTAAQDSKFSSPSIHMNHPPSEPAQLHHQH